MEVKIVDDIGEQNNIALRWILKATQEGEILGLPASHEKFDISGAEVFHFENGKIKEAWTIYDGLKLALELGLVEIVQPQDSNK
jgi:predicted ester cyclase